MRYVMAEPFTCPHCGHKHWPRQPCVGEMKTTPALVDRVVKAVRAAEAKKPPPKKSDAKVPAPGIVVGYDFKAAANCPECAMRRAKAAARQKQYRERKKA